MIAPAAVSMVSLAVGRYRATCVAWPYSLCLPVLTTRAMTAILQPPEGVKGPHHAVAHQVCRVVVTYQTLPQQLAQVELFKEVPESVLSDLVSAGSTFTTPPGGHAVKQGSPSAGLMVVLEGSAIVEVAGVRRPTMGPGDYFGEMSVIDGQERSATVIAGADGLKTFAVSPANFSHLIDKHPTLARALLNALCARIRALESSHLA